MFFGNTLNTKAELQAYECVMPEVAHKKLASRREFVQKTMNAIFLGTEVLFVTCLFIWLYFYRLSGEYGYSLWDQYGLSSQLPRIFEYIIFFAIVIGLWGLLLYHYGLITWRNHVSCGWFEETVRCIKAVSYSVVAAIGVAFIFKLTNYSRFVVISFWLSSIITIVTIRSSRRLLYYFVTSRGILLKRAVIVGAGRLGRLIANEMIADRSLGYQIVGFIDDKKNGTVNQISVLGTLNKLDKILKKYPVDELIITMPSDRDVVQNIVNEYRKYDIKIRIVPETFNLVSKTLVVENINSIPFITLVKTPMRGLVYVIKRFADYFLASIGFILISPLLLITTILIKIDSPGPVLYKQRRVGRNGKYFHMYKFRSMVANAEQLQYTLIDQNEADEVVFKIKNDPRLTKVGRFIRKYSVDELPQLLNVLKGDMSLVGPRPPIPKEVEQYSDVQWRRLEVIPGITGLWQVSGRSELSFDQWVNLDIYYIENWSLLLDLKILLKTIPAVLKGEGAY